MAERCRYCGARHSHLMCTTKQKGKDWVWVKSCTDCGETLDRSIF